MKADTMLAFKTLPPGAEFKQLGGRLRGTYQLRVGGPYRIRFQWKPGIGAVAIQVANFH
ncbi:MAG: hypothetical protein M3Y21_01870 [Candidatus Eremiobacteraeota bacterium]|nr:hypothetical protein [Candidatus Eremiobacteraeota bacterium]